MQDVCLLLKYYIIENCMQTISHKYNYYITENHMLSVPMLLYYTKVHAYYIPATKILHCQNL